MDVHAVKSYSTADCTSQTQSLQPTATETRTENCAAVTVTRTDSVRVQHGHAYGLAKHGEALHSKTTTSTEVTAAGNTCSSASTVSNSSHLPSSNKTTSKTSSGGLHGTTANGNASGTKGATQGNSQEGGVLGATASAGSSGPEGGVLGAIESASGGSCRSPASRSGLP